MSFVKDEAETNDQYLETCRDDPWWPVIERAHARMLAIDANYQIVQIKEKFGGLRFYYESQLALTDESARSEMDAVIRQAEREVAEIR